MNWRIGVFIEDDRSVKSFFESKEGEPTPLEGLALFTKLEPLIDRFKLDVTKTLSAQPDKKGRNGTV